MHRDAGERKYCDAQRRIVASREAARIEKAAIAQQALLDQRAKEQAEANARKCELKVAQAADERLIAQRLLKEQRRLLAQRRRAERKAREIAVEEHEEALFKAQLAARRAAADAEISRLDELRSVR